MRISSSENILLWYVYFVLELSWIYLLMFFMRTLFPSSIGLIFELLSCMFILAGCYLVQIRHGYLLWDLSGLILSLTLPFIPASLLATSTLPIVLCLWMAFSIGFGLPAMLSSVMAFSTFNNRGKIAAFIALGISLILALSLTAHSILKLPLMVLLIVLKASPLVLCAVIQSPLNVEFSTDYSVIKERKTLLAFFFAWLSFMIIDYIATYNLKLIYGESFIEFYVRMLNMSLSLVLLPIIGYLMDRYGRRFFVIASYIVLGFEYAFVSAYKGAIVLYPVFESFAWSTLMLFFIFIVWSDISPPETRMKLYALGFIPVFLGRFSEHLFELLGLSFKRYELYPFVSMFMFMIAALLFLIPETLPRSAIERRRMISYIEKAKKLKEHYR